MTNEQQALIKHWNSGVDFPRAIKNVLVVQEIDGSVIVTQSLELPGLNTMKDRGYWKSDCVMLVHKDGEFTELMTSSFFIYTDGTTISTTDCPRHVW